MTSSARRGFLAALALVTSAAATCAFAQTWPNKPISLVVPFPPGGTTDVLARAIGQQLSTSLGQPVIVESKPGAGATIGADFVAESKPDGYTFLMGAVHHMIATSRRASCAHSPAREPSVRPRCPTCRRSMKRG